MSDASVTLLPAIRLERGAGLSQVRVAYRTWGRLNEGADNAVLVCHALTGGPDAADWWAGLFGPGCALDPADDFIICANVLGGRDGSTGPASISPRTGRRYASTFPDITVRDMARVQLLLLDRLAVGRVRLAIGGSLGGMLVLELGLLAPARIGALAPIACSGRHSAWCIGISELQRQVIACAATPAAGLAIARQIAMLSYRSRDGCEQRFGRGRSPEGRWQIAQWLERHGARLVERFDADTYATLTRAMDSHDVAHGRGDYAEVLRSIRQPTLIVGIDSDVLYPLEEQEELAGLIPGATLSVLRSPHGHDAFLMEAGALNDLVADFRAGLAARAGVTA